MVFIIKGGGPLKNKKENKERMIENHLRFLKFYQTGMKNCERQLEYIMPTLVSKVGNEVNGGYFYIPNDTSNVALDRIESKRALDLRYEIERFKIMIDSIESSLEDLKEQEREFIKYRYFECLEMCEVKKKMGYSEEKSVYRVRRHVLDKLLISLRSILVLN
jgi:hypothetical protein